LEKVYPNADDNASANNIEWEDNVAMMLERCLMRLRGGIAKFLHVFFVHKMHCIASRCEIFAKL
jgi:hypothetical protein